MWNDELHLGNPAAHSSVKEYYLAVLEEQTLARTFIVQATPLFLDKLSLLSSHLCNLAVSPSLKPSTRYILVRDLDFFSIDFFSGDRGSDLGRVKTRDVLTLPEGKGFLINQVSGRLYEETETMYLVLSLSKIPHIAQYLICVFT